MGSFNDVIWLVKSRGRILGPFAKDEISHLLEKKEIAAFDEVCRPNKRWYYIKELPEFAKILEDIRKKRSYTDEVTETGSQDTSSFTDSVTQKISDDLTEDIIADGQKIKEADFIEIKSGTETINEAGSHFESYGFEDDPVYKRKTQRTTRFMWVVSALVIFMALIFVFYQKPKRDAARNLKELNKILPSADRAYSLGYFVEALKNYKLAYAIDEDDPTVNERLGTLLIQFDDQTLEGRKLLFTVLKQQPSNVNNLKLSIGVADIMDGEFTAAEKHFKDVLLTDKTNTSALINIAALNMSRSRYLDASSLLQTAIFSGVKEGAAYVMLAQAAVNLWLADKNIDHLSNASDVIKKYKGLDYIQEIKFINLYLDFLLGRVNKINLRIQDVLDVDPQQTNLHKKNIFIYRNFVDWKSLLPLCLEMTNKVENSYTVTSLASYCLFKSGDINQAKLRLGKAVLQAPKDSMVQSVYGIVLTAVNSPQEAEVAINTAIDYNSSYKMKLPLILKAQSCYNREDIECANLYWDQLISLDSKSLPAIAGMSQILLDENDRNQAESYIDAGLIKSPNYIPFLELKDEINQLVKE